MSVIYAPPPHVMQVAFCRGAAVFCLPQLPWR